MESRAKQKNKGFTLIETLLYIALLAMVIIFLIGFFQKTVFLKGKINERLDNLDNAQYALDRMVWYAQNSIEVNEPKTGETTNRLSVNSLVAEKNPVIFFVEDNILKVQFGNDSPINLTNNRIEVEELDFINYGFANQPGIIKINLTAKGKNSFWQVQPINLQTSVKLER